MIFLFLMSFLQVDSLANDSIPTWKIVYSDIYHQQFVKNYSDFDYQLLQKQNEELHNYIKLHLNTVLDIIPIYTGYPWPKNYHINIYPSRSKISFSHPLTLMYSADQKFLFYMLMHEVVHHNVAKEEFPSLDMYEAFMDKVAIQVSTFLPKSLQGHHRKIVYYPLQKFYEWNIDTINVKEWLENNHHQLDKDKTAYSRLQDVLNHGDEDNVLDYFEPLKQSPFGEFSEKSFYFVIQHFKDKKNYDTAIELSKEYVEKHPDGALYNSIQFSAAEMMMLEENDEEAELILTEITKRNKDINNYLDDAYLRIGDLANGNGNLDKAVKNFLYVLDMLPRGASKVHAANSLARIYAKKDESYSANRFYFKALDAADNDRLRAQILIELSLVLEDRYANLYLDEIVKILSKNLKPDLKNKLQEIYKDLL